MYLITSAAVMSEDSKFEMKQWKFHLLIAARQYDYTNLTHTLKNWRAASLVYQAEPNRNLNKRNKANEVENFDKESTDPRWGKQQTNNNTKIA